MTPEDLLKKAIRRHEMEKEKETMKEFQNNSPQAERREVLKNDRQARTYFERAAETIGEEMGGRFAPLGKASVVGASPSPMPKQSENSPFHHDVVPPEPPLGFSVNDMPTTGTPAEVQASIAAELAKAIDQGAQVVRVPDVVPDPAPTKRRV